MSPHTHTQCLWTTVELWRVQTWKHSSQTDSWLEGQSNLLVQEPQDNLSQTNHIKLHSCVQQSAERKHVENTQVSAEKWTDSMSDIRTLGSSKGRVDTAHTRTHTHAVLCFLWATQTQPISTWQCVLHQLFLCSVSPSTQIQLTFEGRQQGWQYWLMEIISWQKEQI